MRQRQGFSSEGNSGRSEPALGESTEKSAQASLLAAMTEKGFIESAINTMQDAFLVLDFDGRLVNFNEYTKLLTGYNDEELLFKPLTDYLTEEEGQRVEEAFRLGLTGELFRVETWVLCKNGSQVPVEFWGTAFRDQQGSVIGLLAIGRDLTERKRAEAALKEGEEHFRALINNSTDIIEVIDPNNRIEYMSPSAERILGYRPDEMIGKPGFDFNHPDDLAEITDAIARIAETGIPGSVTFRCRHKDGSWLVFEAIGSLLPGPPGEQRLVVNIRDITERVRMQGVLRIAQFEIDNTLDLILRVASEGRILYANQMARKLLGHSSIDILERYIWEILPKVTEDDWPDTWKRRARRFPNRSEVEFKLHDGSRVSLDLVEEIIDFENEEFLVLIGRDITRRKEAEEQLALANRELEIFARTVTHDIMAPLSAISIVSESLGRLIESGDEDKENLMATEMVDTIRSGVEDAIGLATDMVSLSQVQAPGGAVDRVDVRRVVDRVVEQLRPEITTRGADQRVDEPLGEILASPTHIYQLFLNLVSNAVKYNNNRNPVVTVSRLESAAEGVHRYLVRDNGPGVALENIDLIFQPFFKGESGGTGLGLATVMKVVKLYAGAVAVYNDGGACFEFTIHDAKQDVEKG